MEDVIEMVVEKIIPSELIIHPGEKLADILKERGILYDELVAELGVSISYISDVMAGKENISKGLALGLERVLGVPQSFWCNLQANYFAEIDQYGN